MRGVEEGILRMNRLRVIGLTSIICSSCLSFAQGRRLALSIGNDEYRYANHLANAVNDATAIGQELLKTGYQTTIKVNLDRAELIDAIERFSSQIQPGDTAVFYYAGHGLQVDGENILVPTDFNAQSPEDAAFSGYGLSKTLAHFIDRGATTRVIILDSCRDNPFSSQRTLRGGWAQMATSAGTFIAFGTSPGSTAADDPGRDHGLFTEKLLNRFESSTDIEHTLQDVRQDVVVASHGQQVPWAASSLIGDFHLLPVDDSSTPPLEALEFGLPGQPIGGGRSVANLSQEGIEGASIGTRVQVPADYTKKVPARKDVEGILTQQQVSVLIEEAVRLARTGDYDDAVRSLDAVIRSDPRSTLALRVLGLVFHLMGRSVIANETLSRAIALNPEDAIALYYRCLVNAPSDALAAIQDCEAAVSLNPDNAGAHTILAVALLNVGRTADAEKEAKQAIALAPEDLLAASVHGKVLMSLGRFGSAESEFRRAMKQGISERGWSSDQ